MIQKTNITLILTHTKQTRNVSSFFEHPWSTKNHVIVQNGHMTSDERSRDIVLAEKSSI